MALEFRIRTDIRDSSLFHETKSIPIYKKYKRSFSRSHIQLSINNNAKQEFSNRILPEINSNEIICLNNSHFITNFSAFSSVRSMNLNLRTIHQSILLKISCEKLTDYE